MKTICFTGGGTAGHVSPNLALAPYFLEDGYEVHYIGSTNGIEKTMVQHPIIYHEVATGKLRRYFDMKNFTDPFRIIKGYFQSLSILKRIKPSVIFSKGGFVSVPVCLAAKTLGIPVILHESDLTPGLANKLILPYCNVICTSFESTTKYMKGKGVWTGIPIRKELLNGNARYAQSLFKNFDFSKPTLMVVGGSLGATAINECVRKIIDELVVKYNVIHICGKGNIDESLNDLQGYAQFEFVTKELPDFLALCDMVVSRSGATAIFEFLNLLKPMLLIPLPAAQSRGDQILNAKYFEEKGYAKVLKQEDMTMQSLKQAIDAVYEGRDNYIESQKMCKIQDSNKLIIDIIKKNSKEK